MTTDSQTKRVQYPSAALIRPSTDADVPAMTAIYAHAVQHGSGSFEVDPPDVIEMARRRSDVLAKGLPWLVAVQRGEDNGSDNSRQVLGYAYANHFRPRRAYRFTLEDSVYLAPQAQGGGIGRLLLAELIARCEALGARQMLAVIGDPANAASVALHRRLGFQPAGALQDVGHKFGRWLDIVLMQRTLGAGAHTPPQIDVTTAGPLA